MWKAIPGFEGHYEASASGRIRSIKKIPLILKELKHTGGYRRVCLWVNGKDYQFFVHKLILLTFAGPRPVGCQACHADGDKKNNGAFNLRWDTPSANQKDREQHGTEQKGKVRPLRTMSYAEIQEIRRLHAQGLNISTVAKRMGRARTTTADVINCRTWK